MDAAMVTILTTVIVEAAGIIGLLIKSSSERKKNAIEQARRDQKLDDRLDRLEKKVTNIMATHKSLQIQQRQLPQFKKI